MKEEKMCEGVRLKGYWKGYPCHNYGKYELNGKYYCGVHYSIAQTAPERFKLVKRRLEE